MFLKAPGGAPDGEQDDPYGGRFYSIYKGFLRGCIRFRWLSMAVVIGVFVVALMGFGRVDRSFFPPSSRPQLMVDLWLPQGTHIEDTAATVAEIEQNLLGRDGVTHVISLVGQGGLRFLLTYTPEKLNSSYAQLLVDVEDSGRLDGLLEEVEAYLADNHPDLLGYASKFQLGPGSTGKVQARFSGPDPDILRALAARTEEILHADPDAKSIRTDWRQRVKLIRPVLAEKQANQNGIQRPDVALALSAGFEGAPVGVYREEDLLLPIILRADEALRRDVASIWDLQIWSPAAGKMIPLRQVVSGFETTFEDEIIYRSDRKRTLTVFGDPIRGQASALFERVRPQIEALELQAGYELKWDGEYKDSNEARAGLMGSIPLFVLVMVLVTIMLFNSLRQPLIIWLCVPLALIGVTAGLLGTRQPFGFMALLGFLSLSGMLIKNAVVLIDEINLQSGEKELLPAIVDSATSRLRPVAMAAATTALGMIPLLVDAFFVAMAVTIIAGLLFATVLTMVVVPVLYAILYRARAPE
jgi:multidrug efflux pump subunit AcrB